MSYLWQCKECKTIVELDRDMEYDFNPICACCKSDKMVSICKIQYISVS